MSEINVGAVEQSGMKIAEFYDWVLLIDVDFFGRMIFAGTVFKQVNSDYYHPIINGARCPHYQISFMIIKNNPKVFLKLNK